MSLAQTQRYLSKTAFLFLQFLFLILILRLFFVSPGKVNGQSMEETFHDGDLFFVNKIVYFFNPPERFDVVQFIDPEQKDTMLVKRIIGLPGERVEIKNSHIRITSASGEIISIEPESYLPVGTVTQMPPGTETSNVVPKDSYFVLGDNRLYSADSRHFGSVHRKYITGRISH